MSNALQNLSRHIFADADPSVTTGVSFFSVAALAVASQMFTNVYPVFIGALDVSGRATTSQLGQLGTVEYMFMAITAMTAGKFLSPTRLRGPALVVGMLQILAVVASTWVSGYALLAVRAVFAAACGIQVWIQYEFVAYSRQPGRLVGILTFVVTVSALVMSWLGSDYILNRFGVNGLMLFFGAPSVVALLVAWRLPAELNVSTIEGPQVIATHSPLTWSSRFMLASVLLWSAWISVLWIYSEPLARAIGVSAAATHAFVYASLLSSLAGAALGAVLVERWRYSVTLFIGLAVCLIQVWALLSGVGSIAYVFWFSILGFFGYFLVPFFVQGLGVADAGGKSVVFFPAAQYAGASMGPLVASFLVAPGEFYGGVITSLVCIAAAIATLALALAYLRRSRRSSPV